MTTKGEEFNLEHVTKLKLLMENAKEIEEMHLATAAMHFIFLRGSSPKPKDISLSVIEKLCWKMYVSLRTFDWEVALELAQKKWFYSREGFKGVKVGNC